MRTLSNILEIAQYMGALVTALRFALLHETSGSGLNASNISASRHFARRFETVENDCADSIVSFVRPISSHAFLHPVAPF